MLPSGVSMCSFLLIALQAISQSPSLDWQISLGGSADDYGNSVIQTSDGGYLIVGEASSMDGDIIASHGGTECWVVKLGPTGAVQWQRALGGTGTDSGADVVETSDGDLLVVGSTNSSDGDVTINQGSWDVWVVKLDAMGTLLWQRTYGGSNEDYGSSIAITNDGGAIVGGNTTSNDGDVSGNHGNPDAWVMKLDGMGDLEWQHAYGGTDYDFCDFAIPSNDGGYFFAGSTSSDDGDVTGHHGSMDAWVWKVDASGTLLWQRALGGTAFDQAFSARPTGDGGCIVGGWELSTNGDVSGNHGSWDAWAVKLDSNGSITWQRALGGSSPDQAADILSDPDGGYLLIGASASVDGDASGGQGLYDFWIVKLSALGVPLWQKKLGGSDADLAYDGVRTSDGGCIAVGSARSNNGDLTLNQGGTDYWIVKLEPDAVSILEHETDTLRLFPNPASECITLDLSQVSVPIDWNLLDATGRVVRQGVIRGSSPRTLDIAVLRPGAYLLQLHAGERVLYAHFVKE